MQEKILRLGMRSESGGSDAPSNPVERAAVEGDVSAIVDLVNKGVDLNERLRKGWTALHIGSANNHPDLVDALLSHGADPDLELQDGSTALHISAAKGNYTVVEVLLRYKARLNAKRQTDGWTALHFAASRGRHETLKLLLDAIHSYDMDIDQPANDRATALGCACMSDSLECLKLLISAGANVNAVADTQDRTPLMIAAAADEDQVVQTLLEAGADIDQAHPRNGATAVQIASFSGNMKALRSLIQGGANLDTMDNSGRTPLRVAIENKQPEAAMLLLRHRLKVQTAYGDHKVTALHLTVSAGFHEVVKALLEKGADTEARDGDGDTPLQWAVEKGDLEMCRILLRHGAQVNTPNENTGKVMLYWAVRGGHVSVTELLLAYHADRSLVELDQVQKDSAAEENFQTCRILVETAASPSGLPETPTCNESLSSIPTEPGFRTLGDVSGPEEEPAEAHPQLRFTTFEVSQDDADRIISNLTGDVEHTGVKCDGPLCKGKSGNIQGVRFKCASCENVDFCLPCIYSFHNNHNALHPIIRCSLPFHFHPVEEIDDELKKRFIKAADDPLTSEDISHVLYGLPDKESLKSQISSRGNSSQRAEMEELVDKLSPSIIPVMVPSSNHELPDSYRLSDRKPLKLQGASKEYAPQSSKMEHAVKGLTRSMKEFRMPSASDKKPDDVPRFSRGITRYGDIRPGGVVAYKIDESGMVRARGYYKDDPENTPREDDVAVHHQDPELLVRLAITGEIQPYDYEKDRTLYQWANEGRLVTRVIDIKPGRFDDKIDIDIRVVDIRTGPSYEALSYTWKETAYERAILSSWTREDSEMAQKMARFLYGVYCKDESGNERYLLVNCGLRDALKRLRHTTETKTFWIDQLSINQQNLSERAFQVQYMKFFYNRAKQVTLWVGDEDENINEVFDIFWKIAEQFSEQGFPPDPDSMMANPQLELPPFESPVWRSVVAFFNRPVFSRCWVIQEVVTAQKVIVRCGDLTFHWRDLAHVTHTLGQRAWLKVLPRDQLLKSFPFFQSSSTSLEQSKSNLPGFQNPMIMNGLREDFQKLKRKSLEDLLYDTSVFEATDPRDKIYSVLGIQSAWADPNDPHHIQTDYEKSVEEVFLNATRVCIMQSSSLTICGMNSGPLNKNGRRQGLPSWVPDFTASASKAILALCRPVPPNPYHACGDVPLIAAWPYEERPDILASSSCKVDSITRVSQQCLSGRETLPSVIVEWMQMASIIGADYPTGEFAPDAFCRACVADIGSLYLRQSPMPRAFYISLCRLFANAFGEYVASECERTNRALEDVLQENVNPIIATLMKDVFAVEEIGAADDAGAQSNPTPSASDNGTAVGGSAIQQTAVEIDPAAEEVMFLACQYRRFYMTENGLFGFATKDIQVGDEVHVLSGTSVPFVLRPAVAGTEGSETQADGEKLLEALRMAGEDGMKLYEMVGEAYIHGYMQGQILAKNDVEWEGICIC